MATKPKDDSLSMPALIKALGEGQTYSKSERVKTEGIADVSLTSVLAKLRNNVNQCVSRIRKETGTNFRVESTTGLTDDKLAVICTVAVTRLDEEDDDEVDI